MNTETYTENYLKKDYVVEADLRINEPVLDNRKDFYLKIGLGVVYVSLLLLSLFVV
jgi:hypothetical protein